MQQNQEQYTEEQIKKKIKEMLEKNKIQRALAFKKAKKEMIEIEEQLVETLGENQIDLYKKFCKKRNNFYKKASLVYTKNYKIKENIENLDENLNTIEE